MYGIDLVAVRVPVDWARVRESGRTFAFVRASYGSAVDPAFSQSWRAMRDAGITRGAWQVLRHDEDPIEQAIQFLKVLDLQRGDLPPMLDLERMATSSPNTVIGMMKSWIAVIESELEARHGCTFHPIIRTSSRAWPVRREPCGLEKHSLWIIDASRLDPPTMPKCMPANEWLFHQYAMGTRGVPGVPGLAQLSRFNPSALGDRGWRVDAVKRLLRGAGFTIPDSAELDEDTRRALLQFQAARGLVEDGIVGPKTFAELHWTG